MEAQRKIDNSESNLTLTEIKMNYKCKCDETETCSVLRLLEAKNKIK